MTSLIQHVERHLSARSADVWEEILGSSKELGERLQSLVRSVLIGPPKSVADLDYDDLVGLAMAVMAKFQAHCQPVWSSHALREHLGRFFALPGASARALLEGEARVLGDAADGPSIAFAEDVLRIIAFETSDAAIGPSDVGQLVAVARSLRKPTFWFQILMLAQQAHEADPALVAEALVGMRSQTLRERAVEGIRDALEEPSTLERCLKEVRELDPEQSGAIALALRAVGLHPPRLQTDQ